MCMHIEVRMCMHSRNVHAHWCLTVHAQLQCACTVIMCMHSRNVHAQSQCACTLKYQCACTVAMCMHSRNVHAQSQCACTLTSQYFDRKSSVKKQPVSIHLTKDVPYNYPSLYHVYSFIIHSSNLACAILNPALLWHSSKLVGTSSFSVSRNLPV